MNTAIANAVVKSGVITINLPQSADVSAQKRPPVSSDSVSRPANDKGRAYVSPDNGRMNAPVGEMGAAGFSAAANAAQQNSRHSSTATGFFHPMLFILSILS